MVAMFALLILTLIGLAMLTRATTEVLINDNFKRSKTTFLTAEAGTEEARYRLTAAAGANRIDNLFSDGTASTKVVYIRANASINPTDQSSSNRYRDAEYANSRNTQRKRYTKQRYLDDVWTNSDVPHQCHDRHDSLCVGEGDSENRETRRPERGQRWHQPEFPVYYGPSNIKGKISQYVRDAANALTHDLTYSNPVYLITAMSLDGTGAQRKIQTESSSCLRLKPTRPSTHFRTSIFRAT